MFYIPVIAHLIPGDPQADGGSTMNGKDQATMTNQGVIKAYCSSTDLDP